MLGMWSKESKLKKKAGHLVSIVKRSLLKNSDKLNPEVAELIRQKINGVENELSGNATGALEKKADELESVYNEHLAKFGKSKLRQNVEALLWAVGLALLVRTFIVQPFKIPSGSMIPTLLVGDHLLVNKFAYGTKIPFTGIEILPLEEIERGDVVVFTYPNTEGDPSKKGIYYIKRVVGLPGDSVELSGRDLVINGQVVPVEYVGSYTDERDGDEFDEYDETLPAGTHRAIFRKGKENTTQGRYLPVNEVPEGHVFVMGDNRDNSQDSRFWGFVPISNIAGKAFLIHWSWDFDNRDWASKVRWKRILSDID